MERHHYKLLIFSMTSLVLLVFFSILTWGISSTGSLHLLITRIDFRLENFFYSTPVSFVYIMSIVTLLADPRFIIIIQGIVLVLCIVEKEDTLGGFFLGSMILGEAFVLVLKDLLLQARPGFIPGTLESITYAYPSGHAVVSIIFYGALCYIMLHVFNFRLKDNVRKFLFIFLTAFFIFLIGLSRIALGVHWFSDVIGGWLLGGAILSALIAAGEWANLWHRDTHKWRHALIVCIGIIFLCTSIIAALFVSYL